MEDPRTPEQELEGRLTSLEVLMKDTRDDVRDIKDNHIKEIYKRLDAQKTWLIGVLTSVILTLIVTLLSLYLQSQ